MKTQEKIRRYEDYLLGMLVNWPELVMTVPFDIGIFSARRKVVAELMRQMNAGTRPDVITLSDAFPEDKGLLFELGVLAKDCPGSANYETFLLSLADLVADIDAYQHMAKGLRHITEGGSVREVLADIVNKTLARFNAAGVRKFDYTAQEAMQVMVDKLDKAHEERYSSQQNKLKTGIDKLDEVVGSFQPTDLVVVGARPAVGKTAFCVSVMLNMARAGKRVGFISTEMSVEQIGFRMASQMSGITARKYRDCAFEDHEWPSVTHAAMEISQLGIRINDKPEITISEVIMRCRAWDMVERLDVVLVDYLTRIKPDKEYNSKNLEVGEIATQLKNLARALKIPVIVLAQLNRGSANRSDKTPTMADLRDSGIIEQEADCILLLHREKEKQDDDGKSFFRGGNAGGYQDLRNQIIVEKNRHGEAGTFLDVNFDGAIMRWY